MRIVYLSNSIIPSRQANSIHVMKMCEAFVKNGHETVLIAYGSSNQTEDINDYYGISATFKLTLIRTMNMRGAAFFSLPRLYYELKKYDPRDTLIYARSSYGISLAVRLGYRLIYESHAIPCNKLVHYLERSLIESVRLAKLIVISRALEKLYKSIFGTITNVEVCYDAADIPNPNERLDYLWPSKRDTLQVGYVGHLYKGRGIDIIIGCAKKLPQYDFHIVGGTNKDIAYWKQFKASNLCFHGFVKPSAACYVRSQCDVLLMPYQEELSIANRDINTSSWMSPLKLFEYMSSRKAIISSDLPVLREVLNSDNSILVQPDKLEDWVNAINRCSDSNYRKSLGDNAYGSFLDNYTWEIRAAKVLGGVQL